MHCYHCSAVADTGTSFCGKCGAKLGFTEEIILAAIAKEEKGITYLYNETYNSVFQAIRPLIKDEDTALDILQDTYIKAFESLEQLENPEQFRAWAKRIAQNKSKDWLKKKKPTLFSEMRPDDESGEIDFLDEREFSQPDVTLDKEETGRLLWEIIDSLSDEQRLVVSMYYFQEMQVKEIALELGISENTIKSRLNYARKNIETKVLVLEKQGTKLYSLAPLPFLLWLIRSAAEMPSAATLTKIASTLGASGGAAASAGGAASSAAAAGTTGAAAGISLVTKIVAGIVAAAIAIGGGALLYQTLNSDNEPAEAVGQIDETTSAPSSTTASEQAPSLEDLNADRIAVYLDIVEELGSGEYDDSRYLVYDCDGDGLYELLATTFDSSGLTSDIFTINEAGEPVSFFAYSDSDVRASGNSFLLLTLEGKSYLASSRSEVSGGTGVIYGSYYLLEEVNGRLEQTHIIRWIDFMNEDAKRAYEQSSFNDSQYYFFDDEAMDPDVFINMKESAVSLRDDSLTYSEFIDTYKTTDAPSQTTAGVPQIDYTGFSYKGESGMEFFEIDAVDEVILITYTAIIADVVDRELKSQSTIFGSYEGNTFIMERVEVGGNEIYRYNQFDFTFYEDRVELTVVSKNPVTGQPHGTYILTK